MTGHMSVKRKAWLASPAADTDLPPWQTAGESHKGIGTHVFLLALFCEATHHEENTRIKWTPTNLYRQVDTPDSVLS
jgi:hypothetical protein